MVITLSVEIILFSVPPQWIIEPRHTEAIHEEVVVLSCIVDGEPKPTISWRRSSGQRLQNFRKRVPPKYCKPISFSSLLDHSIALVKTK